MPSKTELGKRLKRARSQRDMTLKQVESRSGVSATHISQIERGMTSPTIGALQKLSKALEKDTIFFLEDVELEDVSVCREPAGTVVLDENPKVILRSLSRGIPGGKLRIARLEAGPSGEFATPPHRHEGEECGIVTKGILEIKINDKSYVLNPGDTIHFPATLPHSYRNPGTEETQAIWINSTPGLI